MLYSALHKAGRHSFCRPVRSYCKNKINVRILLKNINFIHNAVKIPKLAVERIANE